MSQSAGGLDEGKRVFRIDIEPHAAVFGAKIPCAVGPRAAAAVAGGGAEDDILRQVFVHRAKAVGGPGADGGEGSFARVTAGLEGQLRAVVIVHGPQRADDGDVVGTLADAGEP